MSGGLGLCLYSIGVSIAFICFLGGVWGSVMTGIAVSHSWDEQLHSLFL
jgi:hypothetical protein